MQYRIGNYTLCTIEGLAKGPDGDIKIRPKTLQVLEYLLEHRQRIVTKREIIDTIWDDVVVQDQVLFQSIKELRDLFGELTVIKTFPRKGYQWVAEIVDVKAESDKAQQAQQQSSENAGRRGWWGASAALALILVVALFVNWPSGQTESPRQLRIAVLPIADEMTDRDHQWVQLEGMDILIHQLQQASSLQVINTDDILFSLERSHSYAEATAEDQIYRVRQSTGADVIVQTQLRGYPQDYQLHYSLVSPHNVERGVEFSDTIPGLMQALIKTVIKRFGQQAGEVLAYKSDFSNEAFASGVEHYMTEAFDTAEPFLRAAVTANPELLAARRFLAGTLAHQGKLDEAQGYLQENVTRAAESGDHREEVRAILMLGNWLANDGQVEEAQEYLSRARTLAEQYGDQLFIAYSYEELGRMSRRSGDYEEAEKLLKTALGYQQSFRCPYGQTNVLVELGSNAFALGHSDDAERYLNEALKISDENGVAVNRFWTRLALADMHSANGDLERSQLLAQEAKTLADDVHDDYLVNKANHWLSADLK